MTDWQAWHSGYDDPESSLARRLRVVQRLLTELLSRDVPPPRRVLSLCSGDGRDVLTVLARQPAERRPDVVLVELDPALAASAERRAADSGVAVTVVVGDAGDPATWESFVPVDVLMLCGIFGNISAGDIRTTIDHLPSVLTSQGAVIWTRGYFAGDDLRSHIRSWFTDAGFVEMAYDSEPTGYGVGVNIRAATETSAALPDRLFAFVR